MAKKEGHRRQEIESTGCAENDKYVMIKYLQIPSIS